MENRITPKKELRAAADDNGGGGGGSQINLPNPGTEVPTGTPQPPQPNPGNPVPVEQ